MATNGKASIKKEVVANIKFMKREILVEKLGKLSGENVDIHIFCVYDRFHQCRLTLISVSS